MNEGCCKDQFITEITSAAKQAGVKLRWYTSKDDLFNNINTDMNGNARYGNSRISRWTYFGHGLPGTLNTTYSGGYPFDDNITVADINSGALWQSSFTSDAIGISCSCNGAAPGDNGQSMQDAWLNAGLVMEFYAVRGRTSYRSASEPNIKDRKVKLGSGATWIPYPPPQ